MIRWVRLPLEQRTIPASKLNNHGKHEQLTYVGISAMQAFKDKSFEELRLADLKATSDLLPAPSTSPLKTNDEKAS